MSENGGSPAGATRRGRLPDLRAGKSASQTDPINSEGFERVADSAQRYRSAVAATHPEGMWRSRKSGMDARWPSVTFACKKCGKVVTTKPGSRDKRTMFCSQKCSESYWKHRRYREKRKEAREQLKAERSVERDVKVICPMCGVEFIAPTPNRVFCSLKCHSLYYYRFGKHGFPVKRFTCDLPGCDKTVVTNGDDDRRYRFCCYEHARKFWRDPPRNSPYKNQKWRSISEYASWERRTNGYE